MPIPDPEDNIHDIPDAQQGIEAVPRPTCVCLDLDLAVVDFFASWAGKHTGKIWSPEKCMVFEKCTLVS